MDPITTANNRLMYLIRQVNPNTIWGLVIHEAADAGIINQLFDELRSQGKDCPEVLRNIVGDELFNIIMHSSYAD